MTKGSFYWHFKDRGELMEALLREWEEETQLLTDALKTADPLGALPAVLDELGAAESQQRAGEVAVGRRDLRVGGARSAASPSASIRAERERMMLFRKLTGKRDVADLFYYAYHGYSAPPAACSGGGGRLRGHRTERAARLQEASSRAPVPGATPRRVRHRHDGRRPCCRAARRLRIIRHRDPAADRPKAIFDQRVVHRADRPDTVHRGADLADRSRHRDGA